jgi:hypothetical protein
MSRRRRSRRRRTRGAPRATALAPLGSRRLAALRADLATRRRAGRPARWNADPEDVQRAVVKLVLALVEMLRQLFEKQAVRRLEAGTLNAQEIEALGLALMRLESTVRQLARRFRIPPEELNLDLGPLGRLT